MILKSDGEPAIVSVRTALGQFHGGRVIPETPPRNESQSNGIVEEAGKTIGLAVDEPVGVGFRVVSGA